MRNKVALDEDAILILDALMETMGHMVINHEVTAPDAFVLSFQNDRALQITVTART